MTARDETLRDASEPDDVGPGAGGARPGLLVVFSGATPMRVSIPLGEGRTEVGRTLLEAHGVEDPRASRRHAAVERGARGVVVHDLGSTNGVFVNGERVAGSVLVPPGPSAVLRLGRTVMLVAADVGPYEAAPPVAREGVVAGAALASVHRRVVALAQAGHGVFLRGESGVGKEIAAAAFHRAGPRAAGPFVAVNCAAVPRELAERLFFGAVRGAYSGADQSAQGYVQAADGGTLFLDEVADLDLSVQAKLLRVLDAREVVPLGATRPQGVTLGLCVATLRDLRAEVAAGRFREDLYYRVGRPEVRLPPLRERLDEVAYFVDRAVRDARVLAGASLVEACLLRPWPGNVRELVAEVRTAAAAAVAAGAPEVAREHLDADAGRPIGEGRSVTPPVELAPSEEPAPSAEGDVADDDEAVRGAAAGIGLAQKTVRKLFPREALRALAAGLQGASPEASLALLRASAAAALRARFEANGHAHGAVAGELGLSRTTLARLCDQLDVPRAAAMSLAQVEAALRAAGGDLDEAARALEVSPAALKKRLAALQGDGG